MNLVLHPATRREIDRLIETKPHALLLVGKSGIGKKSLARYLGEAILDINNLDNYPYVLNLKSVDNKAISIEQVRELEHFLSLKVPGDRRIKRLCILTDANKLTIEAQNALLKTLEEPPSDTVIIMSTTHAQLLLPTITSRVQAVSITTPDRASLEELYQDYEKADFDRAYVISGGLPGLLHALLEDEEHPLKEATALAREILSKSSYERLNMVNDLSKDVALTLDTLQIMEQMAKISLQKTNDPKSKRTWQKVLNASYNTSKALSGNAQTKLVLLNLMLDL